jgi:Domain of unknown function (DUF4157)
MGKSAQRATKKTAPNSHASPFFKSGESRGTFFQPKLQVGAPGDHFEQEADRAADRAMAAPAGQPPAKTSFFKASPAVQRQPQDQASKVLTEGLSLTYEQAKDQPGFEEWKEKQTKALKYRLWENQPTELKAGIITFGLSSAGILGSTLALDPHYRGAAINTLQDTNVLLPLSLLPYSEYFPLSGFKYKLPTAADAPYTFQTEFDFDGWFKLAHKKLGIPKVSLGVGIDSAYQQQGGFTAFTGGHIKLKLGGGIVNLSGFINEPLPPTPMLVSDPTRGEPPVWMMRSLPGQLESNLPKGSGVFLTVDVARLPELFKSEVPKRDAAVQRKESSSGNAPGTTGTATPAVMQELHSGTAEALPESTRALMEHRFGSDFSGVRIHRGEQAAESAQSIDARAYTSGNDIVFNSGEYQPHTSSGQRLLAHELVHTLQQTGGVQRKEQSAPTSAVKDLRDLLEEGSYRSAYLKLGDIVQWEGEKAKKEWLAGQPEIRFLFLKNRPVEFIAGVSSLGELMALAPDKAFPIIDTWYQEEPAERAAHQYHEKEALYVANLPLFDHLLAAISPYTGEPIEPAVKQLFARIDSKKPYGSDAHNPEFHDINLLAPSVERKIKFYERFKPLGLLDAVQKKFDPFTGLSIRTMEKLTETNKPNRAKALEIYNILKNLPDDEPRRAFLETALFAGALEADSDAQKYYKEKYKQQYKALPHNWNFEFWFWNWGEAPFADRVTVDHVAAMSKALFYEDIERRKFGFDRGIAGPEGRTAADSGGERIPDSLRLLSELNNDRNFNDPQRLAILLAIAVRGGLEKEVTGQVLLPRDAAQKLSGEALAVVERYGFLAKNRFTYHDDEMNQDAKHDASRTWYIVTRTLFKWDSGSVFGEQRGTFDLRRLQDTKDQLGSLGGMRFGSRPYQGEDYSTWLDDAVKAHPGSSTLLANIRETKGADRQGKIFASVRDDIRQANVYASTLPIESLNLFRGGSLYRSGPGVLQGLQVHLAWTKDTSEPDNSLELQVDIDNVQINQFEMISPASTLTLGQLAAGGLRVRLSQNNLAAAQGFFLGFLKNADFTLNALIQLLPNMLTLLPYAVMSMVEELKGAEHKYKDALGEVLKSDFSALDASVTFLRLQVRNMYDTKAGFLDDISIEQRGKDDKPQRQGLRVQQDQFWGTDASLHLKEKIRLIDEEIRAAKSDLAGTDHAKRMTKLEARKHELIEIASKKNLAYEDNSKEMDELRAIARELRRLDTELDGLFKQAQSENPLYYPMKFTILEQDRAKLQSDLDYIETGYDKDKQTATKGSDASARFEARSRIQDFEAKYKSVDVRLAFRGVTLYGGNYVRDLINGSLTSYGFVEPQIEGIENINIGKVDSSFVASGLGVSRHLNEAGLAVDGVHCPQIKAKAIDFHTDSMQIKAGMPLLEDVRLALTIEFAKNPLAKDPHHPYRKLINKVDVRRATLNGLTVTFGPDSLVDFPAEVPVQVWGLHLSDFDPDVKVVNLTIQDIKAAGKYSDTTPDKKTGKPQSTEIGFGIDSTTDGKPRVKQPPALALYYDHQNKILATQVNLPSATIRSLAIDSPTLKINSTKDADAVQLDEVSAGVMVTFAREGGLGEADVPTVIYIDHVNVGKMTARGIVLQSFEAEETDPGKAKKKTGPKTIQEVALPKTDPIEIEKIEVKGLRITLDEKETRLSATGEDASIAVGKTDLSGIAYKEKTARGSVLQAFNLQRGKFDSLELAAVHRAGRSYTLKQFLQFFGRTRLSGLDVEGTYTKGKTSVTVGAKGKSNVPLSIDYVEPAEKKEGEKQKGHYRIRLPLSRITVPALHIERDDQTIVIPKAASSAATSTATDVDVTLNAYIDFDPAGNAIYDVYLESLSIADLKVYGLEYHSKAPDIDVKLDPVQPLHIPNVKGSGFRFSSWKAFDVFGKEGGWLKAAAEEGQVISAHFESISAALADGKFLGEKNTSGRSALDIDIGSFGFKRDKAGTMTISLGKIAGGFPKLSITQADATTHAKTVTTIGTSGGKAIAAESIDITLGAAGNKVFDAKGLQAGELTVTSVETVGTDKSTTQVKFGPKALGAESALVKLNQNGSKEITIRNIKGGQIDVDLISTGVKGKSENYIKLPEPDAISLEELKIAIDPDGVRRFTAVKPTLKKVSLRSPSQTTPGDYVSIVADIAVNGKVELGDGQFDTLSFAKPGDAFIGLVDDNAPIEITNVKVEIKDTSKDEPEKDEPEKPLTADQEKLIELQKAGDKAEATLKATPAARPARGGGSIPNPQWPGVYDAYQKAQKAYEDHRAAMIKGAKTAAQESIYKKYLDAVSGTVTGSLHVFDSSIPLNIESDQGTLYLELSSKVTDELKAVIRSLVATTVDMPFWSSDDMKAIGKALKRWYVRGVARDWMEAIAEGKAVKVVQVLLREMKIWPGVLETDKTLYGINLNIEGSWLLDLVSEFTSSDEIGIGLCELKYKHPKKDNFYSLYGMIEYLKFVSPTLVSVSGEADKERLKQLAKKVSETEKEVSDKDIGDAVHELVLFIRSNLVREERRLKDTFLHNIKSVSITADVSLRPQEVIKALLAEKEKGSLTFDKGKDTLENVHVEADYVNYTDPKGLVRVGSGPRGDQNLDIPGATYLTQDKGTKVSYKGIDLAPIRMYYEHDVYNIRSKSATIKGLKFGVRTKK